MVQMLFFLGFRSQLQRTRPGEIAALEKELIRAAEASGGRVRRERRYFSVSFDEDALGFWLDMAVLIRAAEEALGRVEAELLGHACVFCRELPPEEAGRFCRSLAFRAGEGRGGGIWCAPDLYPALEPYALFEPPEEGGPGPFPPLPGACLRLKCLKPLAGEPQPPLFPYREKILRTLEQGGGRNTLLLGPEFMGKRDGIRRYCTRLSGEIPPLRVCFGSGGRGPACFADALDREIRGLIQKNAPPETLEKLEKLDYLGARIFRERLGEECSPYTMDTARLFFQGLLELYYGALKGGEAPPALILENIHRADPASFKVFMDAYAGFQHRERLCVFGTYGASGGLSPAAEEQLRGWRRIFSRVVQFDLVSSRPSPEMPPELWEIAYAFSVTGRYFPGPLFQRIFEEEGKNPALIEAAMRMLIARGVVDTPADPRPRIPGFAARAGEKLGERREKVHTLVRKRLLAWVEAGTFRPCFALLRALAELGEKAGDELILKAVRADVAQETCGAIEASLQDASFAAVAGAERSPVLYYLYRTLRALIRGEEGEIREVFQAPPPADDASLFPGYRAQILMNRGAWHTGIRDLPAASAMIKEALLITQGRREGSAQAYRLFALTGLAKGRLEDALEYSSFAVEAAEKAGQDDELAVAAYYAASAQFLFGNLSKAERLILRAEEAARAYGQAEWALRARFFRGRLRFEAGLYQDALEIFEELREKPGARGPEREGLVAAWIYRTGAYLGRPLSPPPDLSSPNADLSLFQLEAAYLAEDYPRAGVLAEGLLQEAAPAEAVFLFTERPDWRSGFAQCEWFAQPPGEIRARLAGAYQALALSRLERGREEGRGPQLPARDGLPPDTDPQDVFYCLARYRILRESGAPVVDTNTAVSLAFKRLQRRASRIDDVEMRRAFLSRHYWNALLSAAAKEHKLI
jgi:tetratricopeptide (TPR) repeat protein